MDFAKSSTCDESFMANAGHTTHDPTIIALRGFSFPGRWHEILSVLDGDDAKNVRMVEAH